MIEEFKYKYKDEITCPYCGEEYLDSQEIGNNTNEGNLGKQECDHCEKKFTASRNMSITYNSYLAPCLNGEGKHDWRPMIGIPKEYFKDKFRCYICGKEEKRINTNQEEEKKE